MQDPATLISSFAMAWDVYGGYLQLLLALLFGWHVLNWLSTITARVDGLSMTLTDLRKDLEEMREAVRVSQNGQDQRPGGD